MNPSIVKFRADQKQALADFEDRMKKFPPKSWGFIPTDKTREIIETLLKKNKRTKISLQRTRTGFINEACEKMGKG